MTLIALLLAQGALTQPVAAPPAMAVQAIDEDDREIVVMARRSKVWRGSWWTENVQTSCKTERSSGNSRIDALGCRNMLVCGPLHSAEVLALIRAGRKAGTIRTQQDARRAARPAMKKIESCMRDKWRAGLRALRRQRVALLWELQPASTRIIRADWPRGQVPMIRRLGSL